MSDTDGICDPIDYAVRGHRPQARDATLTLPVAGSGAVHWSYPVAGLARGSALPL